MSFGCVIVPPDYDTAASAGFDYVELSGRGVEAMSVWEYTELKNMLSGGKLPCLGFNAYCPPEVVIAGPGFDLSIAVGYALNLLPRASELGVRFIGIGSPRSRNLPFGFDRAKASEQAEAFFDATARVFEPAGITVCVEALGPCYCNFINTLAEARALVRSAARPNLRLVIDFYNMEQSGEADMPLDGFAVDIAHAHISDDAGDPGKRWFLRGEKRALQITRLRRLFAAGYHGNVTAETDLPIERYAAETTLDILREAARAS